MATVSWRPAVGWATCAALAVMLLSLLASPPPRDLASYVFLKTVPLGDGRGTLAGAPADIVEANGWHLPATYRYQYFSPGAGAATDVEVLATYYVTPRTDARKLTELYATRPWQPSTAVQNTAWAKNAIQHSSESRYAWMEIADEHGIYLVARVGPDGHSTSTEQQVLQGRVDRRRSHPLQALSWPFSAHPDVDQRAVWLSMTVSKHVDGVTRSPEEIAVLWNGVLAAFSAHVPVALRGDQVFKDS